MLFVRNTASALELAPLAQATGLFILFCLLDEGGRKRVLTKKKEEAR